MCKCIIQQVLHGSDIYMNSKGKTHTYNHQFYTTETVIEKYPGVFAAESPPVNTPGSVHGREVRDG